MNAAECRIIAGALSAYAAQFDTSSLIEVEERRSSLFEASLVEMRKRGYSTSAVEGTHRPLDTTPQEVVDWLLEFAEFNTVAASSGGYRVL